MAGSPSAATGGGASRSVKFSLRFSTREECPLHRHLSHHSRSSASSSAAASTTSPLSSGRNRATPGRSPSIAYSLHHAHQPLSLVSPIVDESDLESLTFQLHATHTVYSSHRPTAVDASAVTLRTLVFPRSETSDGYSSSRCVLVNNLFANMSNVTAAGVSAAVPTATNGTTSTASSSPGSPDAPAARRLDKDLFISVETNGNSSAAAALSRYFGTNAGGGSGSGGGGSSSGGSGQLPRVPGSLLSYCVGSVDPRVTNPSTRARDAPVLVLFPLDTAPGERPLQRIIFSSVCTSHAIGLLFDGAEVAAIETVGATEAKSATVKCELYLVLGFETGDIVVFACGRESIIARLNSSAKGAPVAQHWPSAVSCVTILQNQVPQVDSATRHRTPATLSVPALQNGVDAQLARHAILCFVGFDSGAAALVHIGRDAVTLTRRFDKFGPSRLVACALAPCDDAAVGFGNLQPQLQPPPLAQAAASASGSAAAQRLATWNADSLGPAVCAVGTQDGDVFVLSVPDLNTVAEYKTYNSDRGTSGAVTALTWSHHWNTRALFVAAEDDTIHVLRFVVELRGVHPSSKENPLSAAASASGGSGAASSLVFRLNFLGRLVCHRAAVTSIAVFPSPMRCEDAFLIATSYDHTASCWHTEEFLPCALCRAGATAGGAGGATRKSPVPLLLQHVKGSPTRRRPSGDIASFAAAHADETSGGHSASDAAGTNNGAPSVEFSVESEVTLTLVRPHTEELAVQVVALDGYFVTACTGGRLKLWKCVPPLEVQTLDEALAAATAATSTT